MKVVVILEIDPDQVIASAHDNPEDFDGTLGGAVEKELGWVNDSGIFPHQVIEPDEIPGNDAELGALVRKSLR